MSFPAPWRPSNALIFALSVPATQVNAQQPVNFGLGGGTMRIVNTGNTSILVVFYNFALNGLPTLTFPATGSPPVGQPVAGSIVGASTAVLLAPSAGAGNGSICYVDAPGSCDSFSAIGSAAGPSVIYVQRGEGNGP